MDIKPTMDSQFLDIEVLFEDKVSSDPALDACCCCSASCCCTAAASATENEEK